MAIRLQQTDVIGADAAANKPAAHGRPPTACLGPAVQYFVRKTRTVLTALFDKVQARNPSGFPAREMLWKATIEGAQAVGLGDEVGSLEPGKQADLIGVKLSSCPRG